MSWSDTKPGAIKSECLKSDYDLVFDNQQRLKDEFGGRMIRVRGAAKVMAHLMFGIMALTADQLLRIVQ